MSAKVPKECPIDGQKLDKKGSCINGHVFIYGATVSELKKGFSSDHRKERKP